MQVSWVIRSKERVCEWTFQNPSFRFSVGQDIDEFFNMVDALSKMVAEVRELMSGGMDKQAAIEEVERMLKSKQTGVVVSLPTTALFFQVSNDSTQVWEQVKQAVVNGLRQQNGNRNVVPVLTAQMPCGYNFVLRAYADIMALEKKDIPCPCGDPTHWLIKCEVIR